nr:MAG TPA: hypothetical protein [Caudoviricetes sp.]
MPYLFTSFLFVSFLLSFYDCIIGYLFANVKHFLLFKRSNNC